MPKQSKARKERSLALKITNDTYNTVYDRDQGCALCQTIGIHKDFTKNPILECHHFVPRSRSGMGIEENLVMLCFNHHKECNKYTDEIEKYFKSKYDDWDKEMLVWTRF